MSFLCGAECVVCFGCSRWAWKRCTYVGSDDSASWPLATPDEFEPVPRICRVILAVYEENLQNPKFPPRGGYRMNPDWVIKRVTYEQTQGHAPPYLIYIDHETHEIILAIRGLNLVKESDYKLLLDNKLGMQMFDGGYAHHGLLKSAIWLLSEESETLKQLWVDNGSSYKMTFAGHSLGSGVAALLAVVAVNHRDRLGGIPRSLIRAYAVAPARCMSLNLAVKYADVIYSVVLQTRRYRKITIIVNQGKEFVVKISDICHFTNWALDYTASPRSFLIMETDSDKPNMLSPRMISYQELRHPWKIFLNQSSGFNALDSLPCLLFVVCLRDTFIPEGRKLRDPRRLYAPGRIYHIVERKFCRCGRFSPEVRTAIPVDGRFEHIVLSTNATSDHSIIWIIRETEKALQRMRESSVKTTTTAPKAQKLERLKTLEKEHKDALERAVSLNVPHAVGPEEQPIGDSDSVASQDQGKIPQAADQSPLVEEPTGIKLLRSSSAELSQETLN